MDMVYFVWQNNLQFNGFTVIVSHSDDISSPSTPGGVFLQEVVFVTLGCG